MVKKPLFIDTKHGRIFVLHVQPREMHNNNLVIFVPAFAEEMNKTRHFQYLIASDIARKNLSSVIFDYYGTGDSEGDFSDNSLITWYENIECITEWGLDNGYKTITLVGVRLGALVAAYFYNVYIKSSKKTCGIKKLVFCQPVIDGGNYMKQFLRLRMAADFISDKEKVTTQSLIEALEVGESVEVAGYQINSKLFQDISMLKMQDVISALNVPVEWFEVVADAQQGMSFSSRNLLGSENWAIKPGTHVIQGEPFWATPEISINRELIKSISEYLP